MDFDDTKEEAAFREEVRAWMKEHSRERDPGQLSTSHSFYDFDDIFVAEGKKWQRCIYDGGYAGITWPVEFGGRGGTFVEAMIFRQEEAKFDVASSLFAVGIGMAGPTIIGHGTDEQRRRYLPAMLRGEEVWCQLFSEPGAGSDLASLSTRAVRDGDEWIVNGQKVWSSGAHHSDMGILLARTDPDLPKHRGMTFFILDMRSPGVEVRPLRQMTGGGDLQRGLLHRRSGSGSKCGGRGQRRLASHHDDAGQRAQLGGWHVQLSADSPVGPRLRGDQRPPPPPASRQLLHQAGDLPVPRVSDSDGSEQGHVVS
jgi:alkylation response protein AidB-like acyl-CoA dehydrogenase